MVEIDPNKQYFSIRADVMKDLILELTNSPHLKKILGEPIEEKILFVVAENELLVIPTPNSKLTEQEMRMVKEIVKLSFAKVVDFKKD